ncbi:hypothetical protein PIB30_052208, partial [Stylosanthes scabra]|nr:hypothetical protein [Stylosanthes scabra]
MASNATTTSFNPGIHYGFQLSLVGEIRLNPFNKILLPEIISSRTTPKPYTSLFTYNVGGQEDAHDFLLQVLDKVKGCFSDGAANPVDTVFRGETVSEGALDSYTKVEKIEANCVDCKELVVMGKQLLLSKTPKILVLQLKRFKKVESTNTYTKINQHVKYEVDLNLKEYSSKKEEDVKYKNDLYAIVVHKAPKTSGFQASRKLDLGHYYCIVRTEENTWYKLDDVQ